MKSFPVMIVVLVIVFPFLASCSGNECAATTTGLADEDSDCIADTADNCVGLYNPSQFDGDEDGAGAACDTDDTDDSVGLSLTDGVDEYEEHEDYEEYDEDIEDEDIEDEEFLD